MPLGYPTRGEHWLHSTEPRSDQGTHDSFWRPGLVANLVSHIGVVRAQEESEALDVRSVGFLPSSLGETWRYSCDQLPVNMVTEQGAEKMIGSEELIDNYEIDWINRRLSKSSSTCSLCTDVKPHSPNFKAIVSFQMMLRCYSGS